MNRNIPAIFLTIFLLAPVVAFAADADLKSTVAAAVQTLSDQASYQWSTTVRAEGGGPFRGTTSATGQVEKAGYTWVSSTSPQGSFEFARKTDKAAVLIAGTWMTMDQAAGRSPAGGRGGGPSAATTDCKMPTTQVAEILSQATTFKQEAGTITAELSAEAVNELMNAAGPFGGRGRGAGGGGRGGRGGGFGAPLRDATGTVTFALKDGLLTQYTIALSGTRTISGNEEKQTRATTTTFAAIGSTTVNLPADAKEAIDAQIAGRPSKVFVPEPG